MTNISILLVKIYSVVNNLLDFTSTQLFDHPDKIGSLDHDLSADHIQKNTVDDMINYGELNYILLLRLASSMDMVVTC